MDVRKISTQSRIVEGLVQALSSKKLCACQIDDIVKYAGISKKTFYNYFNNKQDLVKKVESEIIANLRLALSHDRKSLEQARGKSAKGIVELANYAFDKTIKYCDEHKNLLAVLLSDTGDMSLYHAILKVANEEFVQRVPYLFGKSQKQVTRLPLFGFFQTLYVNQIILLLVYWINHPSMMSVQKVKELVGIVLTNSSVQLMNQLLS